MTDYYYHEQLKKLNEATYKDKKPKLIDGWKYLTCLNLSDGFYCDIYKKNGKYVIVNRGTDFFKGFDEARKDLTSDIEMYEEKLPQQAKHAREVYQMVKCILKEGESIVVTGYSLGGSLAQIVGAETGVETVTFNAYGTRNLKGINIKYEKNIINYGASADPIYNFAFDNHIGKRIIVPSICDTSNEFNRSEVPITEIDIRNHFLENMKPLSKGVEYSAEKMYKSSLPPFKLKVKMDNYRDEMFDLKNRVFYKSEFPSNEENAHLIPEYIHQYYENNGKMPTKEELDARVRTGELIYVESYTRSDGTKVSGYYRRYPRD